MAEEFGLSVVLKLDDRLSGPMGRVAGAFTRMQSAYRKHGQAMRDVGRNMSLYMTLPLLALGTLAARTAVSFESAFTGVRKTVNATGAEFTELQNGFENLTTVIPQSFEQISRVGEAAGQLGIQTESILGFTKVMADLGVTTNLSADDAATALARLANITQMPQKDFDRLGSTVVELGNNLATTEAEIVEMGLRLASAGKQTGLTEAQTLGLAGALSSLGLRAQAGGTAFSRVMIEMSKAVIKGGKEFQIFSRVAGLSGEEFRKLYRADSLVAMQRFLAGITDMGEKSTLVFEELKLGGIRVSDALRRVAGSGALLKDAMILGSKAWEENNALTREAQLRYSTAASQFRIFWNELRLFARDMGALILPVVMKFINDFARPMLRWLRALPAPVKLGMVAFAGLAAVLGPLIFSLGVLNGLFAIMQISMTPALATLLAIGAALGVIVGAVLALNKAIENVRKGDLLGGTTYGLVKNLITSRTEGPGTTPGGAAGLSLPGLMKSATEITLKVLGDKGVAVQSVNKTKGDPSVNVVTEGYLGLMGAN